MGVLGATGAVGAETVALLSRSPAVAEVVALTRRARGPDGFPGAAEGRVAERVVSFGSLQPVDLAGLDAVVCCLGTTAADAGGAAQRHAIDHDYVLEAARLARAEARCQSFSLLFIVSREGHERRQYFRVSALCRKKEIRIEK